MKTVICGGRDYVPTAEDEAAMDAVAHKVTEVVSGCARGADLFGERWAKKHGIPVKKFEPYWDRYGKSAGMIRNTQMASYAEAVIALPGGRGTDHMVGTAKRYNLKILLDLRRINKDVRSATENRCGSRRQRRSGGTQRTH